MREDAAGWLEEGDAGRLSHAAVLPRSDRSRKYSAFPDESVNRAAFFKMG